MDLMPEGFKAAIQGMYYATVACIGGVLGYIYRETRASRSIKFSRLALSGGLAAFIGYHMLFIYQYVGFPPEVIGALNGLTALLGVEFTLYLIERWVLKKFGVQPDDELTKALVAAGWTPPSSVNCSPQHSSQEESEVKS